MNKTDSLSEKSCNSLVFEDEAKVLTFACITTENVKDFPLLLGASRKSVVGLTLDLPADERVEGTITTSIMAVLADYDFVRVHDIKENLRAIKMAEAIKYAGGNF